MMEVLFKTSGRYDVVWDPPCVKLYDTLLDRIAFGNGGYYDNMRGDGRSAVEYAKEAATIINTRNGGRTMKYALFIRWENGWIEVPCSYASSDDAHWAASQWRKKWGRPVAEGDPFRVQEVLEEYRP